VTQSLIAGNYFDKYRSTNPIHKRLVRDFLFAATQLVNTATPETVLEVGCGPGDLAAQLFNGKTKAVIKRYLGLDISDEQIEIARARYPEFTFAVGSAYELPAADKSFDLVMACEVLEHLELPDLALQEVSRVSRSFVLISVPWEPVWCIANLLRGKYVGAFGNTPGHVQHFSRSGIRKLVERHFTIVAELHPFPWTMILAKNNRD
jgi:ubiquinone/menaquinone biosynthesis C-methylase UbiE